MKYTPELVTAYVEKRADFNETDRALIECLKEVDVKNKAVIDIGCGGGNHARLIKAMGASRVVGVDVNEKMIALAKSSGHEGSGVEFMVADGKNLPIESGSIDVVFTNFVVHYFASAKKIFQEMARVLKVGGHVIATFNITDVDLGFEHLYNQAMPIRLGRGEDTIVVQNLMKARAEIEEAMKESGLAVLEERELDHPNAVVDDSFADKEHIRKHAVLFVSQKRG
ncbi:methyltransferase domain-containing protein [Patescibacteria group bacterium]|nr:methyltransferase domain-containing protein [Patescibacteria group bacterium]